MKTLRLFLAGLFLLSCNTPGWTALPIDVNGQTLPSLAPMLKNVMPAVVNISSSSQIASDSNLLLSDPFFRRFFNLPEPADSPKNQSLGSGIIVNARQGYVLTNHHVVDQADEIEVTLKDGRKLQATLLGSDDETDVALLKINAADLVEIPLADSDKLQVGDFAVAIGNPFGLSQTVTSGIISALGRSGLGIEGYENFIQTDASINPGNSGGPLVNLNGQLIGINTAILAPTGGNVGIGFAIPVNMAKAIMEQLIRYGNVNRGHFGLVVQNLTPDLAQALKSKQQSGAVVVSIKENSSAEKAGIQAADIIVRLNDKDIHSATDLTNKLALLRVNEPLTIGLVRTGRLLTVHARIDDPYKDYIKGEEIHWRFANAMLGNVKRQSTEGPISGVEVVNIGADSPMKNMGLQHGDIILFINRQRIRNVDELRRLANNAQSIYRIKLLRGNSFITMAAH